MKIEPKSVEQIIDEAAMHNFASYTAGHFDRKIPVEEFRDFIRSSLASFLIYAIEEAIPKVDFVGTNLSVYTKDVEKYRLALLFLAESINKTE